MADSNITITAGVGTPIDTRTVTGGDHRQVMVIGDPANAAGVAPVDAYNGLTVSLAAHANTTDFVSGATASISDTTSTLLVAAPAAGLRNYVTQITVSNKHATAGTDVFIQDGNGGATIYTIPAASLWGGAVLTFPTPLRQPTAGTALYCAAEAAASIRVSASGYKGA